MKVKQLYGCAVCKLQTACKKKYPTADTKPPCARLADYLQSNSKVVQSA
jgi:hypothetical protein